MNIDTTMGDQQDDRIDTGQATDGRTGAMNIDTTMGDQQDDRIDTGQATDGWTEAIQQQTAEAKTSAVAEEPPKTPQDRGCCLTNLSKWWKPPTLPEKDLMAIPHPDENIQRTFVGVLSSETADKFQAMFRREFCPEIVTLIRGHKLKAECRLVICCLPKNIRQMYFNSNTVFTKLITDAGSLQAMVLIIIFGEKETPEETLHEEDIYGKVLQQGRKLYMEGRIQTSPLDNPYQDNPDTTGNRGNGSLDGLSENIALVTVDDHPTKFQLKYMNKFVERAFIETKKSDDFVDHQHCFQTF